MREVLGKTGCVACCFDCWIYSFIPLLFRKLSSNHSVRQGRHKRGIKGIQTQGLVTLSVGDLSRKFLVFIGNVIKCCCQGIGKVNMKTKGFRGSIRCFSVDSIIDHPYLAE